MHTFGVTIIELVFVIINMNKSKYSNIENACDLNVNKKIWKCQHLIGECVVSMQSPAERIMMELSSENSRF